MNNTKKLWINIIAGAIFLYLATTEPFKVFSKSPYNTDFLVNLTFIAGYIILAISVFLKKGTLLSIGIILEIVSISFAFPDCISQLIWLLDGNNIPFKSVLSFSLVIVASAMIIGAWGLLMLSVLKKDAKNYCFIAMILQFLGHLIREYRLALHPTTLQNGNIAWVGTFVNALILCGAMLLSYHVLTGSALKFNHNVVSTPQNTQQMDSGNQIEKVVKLKELLDMGIITQEEFDDKKKQILEL